MKRIFCIGLVLISLQALAGGGRDLVRQQEKQEKTIKAAHKRGKVTDNEFHKLMDEQKTIKRYIDLADADNYWSLAEKKRVKGKLDRAENRLKRYKHNWEE